MRKHNDSQQVVKHPSIHTLIQTPTYQLRLYYEWVGNSYSRTRECILNDWLNESFHPSSWYMPGLSPPITGQGLFTLPASLCFNTPNSHRNGFGSFLREPGPSLSTLPSHHRYSLLAFLTDSYFHLDFSLLPREHTWPNLALLYNPRENKVLASPPLTQVSSTFVVTGTTAKPKTAPPF